MALSSFLVFKIYYCSVGGAVVRFGGSGSGNVLVKAISNSCRSEKCEVPTNASFGFVGVGVF